MAIAYGLIFALSLIMPPLYFAFIRKKQDEPWLLGLFLCVCVVTLGYFLVSISKTVEFALWANKITYLGQVFVPMCMFMIISKLCGFAYKKWILGVLIGVAVIMYAIVFTTGWLDWYYTNATLEFENGSVANLTASRISLKNMRRHRIFQKDAYITVDFLDKKTDIVRINNVEGEISPLAMTIDLADGTRKQITIEQPDVTPINAIMTELESFHNAIVNNTEPPVTIHDGVQALKVCHLILDEIVKHQQIVQNHLK